MDKISAISNALIGIAIIFVWSSFLFLIITGLILGKIYEAKFYIVVKENVSVKIFDLNKCTDSIRNGYEVYSRHRFGFSNKKIVQICQEFASNLRIGKSLNNIESQSKDEWADRLDRVIKQLKYEESFDDEKANEIISELNGKVDSNSIGQIKQKLIFLEAYHKGVLSVKDIEILELKEKMERKKWFSWISGIIGIIGGLASIISIFL